MNSLALGLFVVWFVVAFVARSVLQKRATGDTGIRAGVLAEGVGAVEAAAGVMLVAALLAGFAAPILAMLGFPMLVGGLAVRVVGAAVATAGIALTFAAQVAMGTEWRIGIDKTEETELVTSGIFGVVRNPIFGAMSIAAAGFALLVPNAIAFTAFVLMVVAIEMQVRAVEEPHLQRLHGSAYRDYVHSVGRFLPRIGRVVGE